MSRIRGNTHLPWMMGILPISNITIASLRIMVACIFVSYQIELFRSSSSMLIFGFYEQVFVMDQTMSSQVTLIPDICIDARSSIPSALIPYLYFICGDAPW